MKPMDFARYLILLFLIVWSFELIPSFWLERITAIFSSQVLNFLGFNSNWYLQEHEAILTLVGGVRDVSVTIIRECTGIHVLGIFAGLVLPLKEGSWTRKGLSLITACLFLFFLNVSRVMLTVVLTVYDIPPFAWIFTNPTIETYHYPLSFIYGFIGVAFLVVIISKWILPELLYTLLNILNFIKAQTWKICVGT